MKVQKLVIVIELPNQFALQHVSKLAKQMRTDTSLTLEGFAGTEGAKVETYLRYPDGSEGKL